MKNEKKLPFCGLENHLVKSKTKPHHCLNSWCILGCDLREGRNLKLGQNFI